MAILNSSELQVNVDTMKAAIHGVDVGMPRSNFSVHYGNNKDMPKVSGYPIRVEGRYKMHPLHYRRVNNSIEFEGSFSACKHGQNVFTSNSVNDLCNIALRRLAKCENLDAVDQSVRDGWFEGLVNLARLDLAVNFRLTPKMVRRVLRQIRRQLIEQYGPTYTNGTSVCWSPQGGKKYSIVFYDKGQQMRASMSRRKEPPKFADKLLAECDGILRVELRLRASELRKLGLSMAKDWTEEKVQSVFLAYMNKLKVFNVTSGPLRRSELAKIPARLRPVLALHKSGIELSDVYSERSCQRHRSAFKKIGIDLRCPNQPNKGKTVNLLDYLSGERQIRKTPQWLIDAGIAPGQAKGQTARAGKPNRVHAKEFTRTSPKGRVAQSGG